MAESVQTSVGSAVRDAVPFLVITGLWIVIMGVVYGLFLVTKPDIRYPAWVHASVFLVPAIGFLGHVLQQALKASHAES